MPVSPLVIGLTGPFGAGCTKVVLPFLKSEFGFDSVSLSDFVREEARKAVGDSLNSMPRKDKRRLLQNVGNEIRKTDASSLAKRAITTITGGGRFVIDSIRNPAEIELFRSTYPSFYLIAVEATRNTRWERLKGEYDLDQGSFYEDDARDKGDDEPSYGQQVEKCVELADVVILNEKRFATRKDADDFLAKVKDYIDLVEKPGIRSPNFDELYMVQAYTASLMSSCSSRQVGSAIVRFMGEDASPHERPGGSYLVSTGWNDVPYGVEACREKGPEYCEKDRRRKEAVEKFLYCPKCGQQVKREDDSETFVCTCGSRLDRDFYPGRLLDLCRAVHAEEAAICQAARLGSATLNGSVLYTTLFPCLLCAKTILAVGISKVIYSQTYPMPESFEMLDGKITLQRYEGVNARAFRRLFSKRT